MKRRRRKAERTAVSSNPKVLEGKGKRDNRRNVRLWENEKRRRKPSEGKGQVREVSGGNDEKAAQIRVWKDGPFE